MTYPWESRPFQDTLGRRFFNTSKSLWSAFAVADSLGRRLTYGKLLVASILLSKKIRDQTLYQDNVALMLPNSVAGVVANLALTLMGKTVINLNYTAGDKNIRSALELCHIQTILTSRLF